MIDKSNKLNMIPNGSKQWDGHAGEGKTVLQAVVERQAGL